MADTGAPDLTALYGLVLAHVGLTNAVAQAATHNHLAVANLLTNNSEEAKKHILEANSALNRYFSEFDNLMAQFKLLIDATL